MRIGYACKCTAVPDTLISTCTAARATQERLEEVTCRNLKALDRILHYNIMNEIKLFRISSDLIPFGSSPVNTLDWAELFSEQLNALGQKALAAGMRLSMHPGQYTVLNSPDPDVVTRAVSDLVYHCQVLDRMGLPSEHKLILHIGGGYGDKKEAIERFCRNYDQIPEQVKKRLVIENDEKNYNIAEVYQIGKRMEIPVIFDNLHYELNLPERAETEEIWIKICRETWKRQDGPQKIHYSQQYEGKRRGAHSQTIHAETFQAFAAKLDSDEIDIMLEVKDKNKSALKCINCTGNRRNIKYLEEEWARYKYAVLSHSQRHYQKIRILLKDKKAFPANEFYRLVEEALMIPGEKGEQLNALDHVWGYFKDKSDKREKNLYLKQMEDFRCGRIEEAVVRRHLHRLALKYNEEYLLHSYFFE